MLGLDGVTGIRFIVLVTVFLVTSTVSVVTGSTSVIMPLRRTFHRDGRIDVLHSIGTD
jgi:hypothetical protein